MVVFVDQVQCMKKGDGRVEMFAIVRGKVQSFAEAFGMIRPDDDIILIEDGIVNLDKSQQAFGSVMPKRFGEEDFVDKPGPKAFTNKLFVLPRLRIATTYGMK